MVAVLDPTALTGFRSGYYAVGDDERIYLVTSDGAIPADGDARDATEITATAIGSDWFSMASGIYIAAPATPITVGNNAFEGRVHGYFHGESATVFLGIGIGLKQSVVGSTPAITLSSLNVSESATIGTTIGTLSVINGTGTYTFSETADPDNMFTVSGSNLNTSAALNYESATSHSVTIQATNGITPISRTFTIGVTNVLEVTLAALALDDTSVPEDSAATINITGASSGSTISLLSGALPVGMTLNSGARTITGTPTTQETAGFTLRETHTDASTGYRDTVLSVTVTAAAPPAPVLTWTSGTSTYDPTFSMTEIAEADVVEIQIDDNADFSSLYDSDTNTVDAGEAASGSLTFAGITTLGFGTTYYARVRYTRAGSTSDWSNTASKAMDAEDVTPSAFTFTDATGVALSSTQTSNTITVAGLSSGTSVAVSITGGTYSKNGGAYVSTAGTAVNGDTFAVRHTSSGSLSTATNTALTIGGVSDTFTSTTTAASGSTATWDTGWDDATYHALSGSNKTVTFPFASWLNPMRSSVSGTGKKVASFTIGATGAQGGVGVCNSSKGAYDADGVNSVRYFSDSYVDFNGSSSGGGWSSYTAGDRIDVAFDTVAERVWLGKNGTWVGDPVAGTGGIDVSAWSGGLYFHAFGRDGTIVTIDPDHTALGALSGFGEI